MYEDVLKSTYLAKHLSISFYGISLSGEGHKLLCLVEQGEMLSAHEVPAQNLC